MLKATHPDWEVEKKAGHDFVYSDAAGIVANLVITESVVDEHGNPVKSDPPFEGKGYKIKGNIITMGKFSEPRSGGGGGPGASGFRDMSALRKKWGIRD